MNKRIYEKFHYKNGENVSHVGHLETTQWHRGVSLINKSRKNFTCVFGCNIPKGSSYVTLEIMAGNGRADSMIDFALCQFHQSETEAISGPLEITKMEPLEIINIWESLLKDEVPFKVGSGFDEETDSQLDILPEEVVKPDTYIEGATKTIHVNVYERNPQARKDCIKAHGCACVVCDFDFEIEYGEIGKNFIHVHHLRQLADIGEKYELNPVEDLRPVCPNCHAMLHKRRPAYTIEELRDIKNTVNKSKHSPN